MEPSELLRYVAESLERLGIEYRIVGSMASIAYGEPRLTNDIDVAVRMKAAHVEDILRLFPSPEYYCSESAVRQAVARSFQFNVIHPASGLKVDFLIADDSDFNQSRFGRGSRQLFDEQHDAWFASPEDVIVKKLSYFKEGGSEKHLRDIVGVLRVQAERIDSQYIHDWCRRLDLESEWTLVVRKMDEGDK